MNSIALPTSNPLTEWLLFLAILVPLRLAIVGLVAWLLAVHNQGKKRQKGRRHHRRSNPTLGETTGLPPKRDRSQPPSGL